MNKVMLIGNVGKEPDVKYYDADQCVAKVSLATTERGYTLKNGTKVPPRTDWHLLVFYKQMAKVVEQYVHKGDKLYVEGRLRYSSYDDQQGRRHNVTEISVENMELLTPKPRTNNGAEGEGMQEGTVSKEPDQLPF
ncbi:MAG: single-stranded DNA-binding protein [Prevotella sp.]|jgi:single-strand DNA-binding protein